MNKDLRLAGPRLILRPVTLEDANIKYCAWLNDPEVNRFLETRFCRQTVASVRSYVQEMQQSHQTVFLAIVLRDSSLHIGNIKLGPVLTPHRRAEISFFLGEKQFWGQGYATEAVGLLTDFALNELQLRKVTAGCYHTNKGSQRVFEKLGYVLEGVLKDHYFSDDVWVDRLCYARF